MKLKLTFNGTQGMHCLMQLFGQRGVPESLRNINMYGVHTFKFGKPEDGTFKYVKIHFKPDAGNITMPAADAVRLAGSEPDYHVKDLYNAIEKGDYPTWTMNIQVMDPKEAETYRWNIFDDTRIWPHADFPLHPVGKLTLNKNPENYFTDVEQAAFRHHAPSAHVQLPRRSALPRRTKLPTTSLQQSSPRLLPLPTRRAHASRQ
jgi:catalase